MMKHALLATLGVCCVCSVLLAQDQPSSQPGAEYKLTLDPAPLKLTQAGFELWAPDTIAKDRKVRAVILNPLYQADTKIYEHPQWRALAARQHAVMMRHDMRTDQGGRANRLPTGDDAVGAIDAALKALGEKIGHPELAQAPLIITGLSQGGGQTTALTGRIPQRVAAAVAFHGGTPRSMPDPQAAQVPVLFVLGSQDDLTARGWFDIQEGLKSPTAWAQLIQPNTPHPTLGDQDFILMWLEKMMELRIAPDGLRKLDLSAGYGGTLSINRRWLATSASAGPMAKLAAASAPAGEGAPAVSWLPDKTLADAWVLSNLTGYPNKHEDHEELAAYAEPAPNNVKIDGKLDEWGKLPNELIWPTQVLPTGSNWHGPDDSSATFAIACDKDFVYFAVRVKDDELIAQGKPPWVQDGVELRIDARPAPQRMANSGRGEGTDFLLVAVGPGPGKGDLFVNDAKALPQGAKVAGAIDDDGKGYAIEVAIPASYLDKMQGGPWKRFRLNVAIGDFDKEGKSQQWWRPDWRTEMSSFGEGTVQKR